VNHVVDDPTRPFVEQGITAEGITIEDDVWIGSGAIVTDGVTVGKGAVVAAGRGRDTKRLAAHDRRRRACPSPPVVGQPGAQARSQVYF